MLELWFVYVLFSYAWSKKSITFDVLGNLPDELEVYPTGFGTFGFVSKVKPEYDGEYRIGKVMDGNVIIKEDSEMLEYRNVVLVYNSDGTTYVGINSIYLVPSTIGLGDTERSQGYAEHRELMEFIGNIRVKELQKVIFHTNGQTLPVQDGNLYYFFSPNLYFSLEIEMSYKELKRNCVHVDISMSLENYPAIKLYADEEGTKNYFIPNMYSSNLVICKVYFRHLIIDSTFENIMDKTISIKGRNKVIVDRIMKNGQRITTTYRIGNSILLIQSQTRNLP